MAEVHKLAPIVLFVYNRPEHTRKTIEALCLNTLAGESEIFIYSDGAKDTARLDKVNEVRSFIKTVSGFKSVTIIEREKNWGLAASIIDGVTNIINLYDKIIVLEDDIVTSPYFLKFMNGALDFYADDPKVWSISGYNYPIKSNGLGEAFFFRNGACWGWGTWKQRWMLFEKNPDKLIKKFSKKDIFNFNIEGSYDIWEQVKANNDKRIDTWAIFWDAAIFKNKGLVLYPSISFVQNIGFDNTGVNCVSDSKFFVLSLNLKEDIQFQNLRVVESKRALKRLKKFFSKKQNIIMRILRKCYRILTRQQTY
jgi:hypothetical protein